MKKTLDQKFWEKYFRVYDALNELIPYQELLNIFISEGKVKSEDIVLDLGSGSGNLAIKLKRMGAHVFGIDSSKGAINIHKQKDPLASITEGDITKTLPFENNFFDLICSNNVIYTIQKENREYLFSELYRVAKPGARIIISNLNKNFSPNKIYLDHIKKSLKKYGIGNTIISVIKFIYPTIMIFWYNYKIKKAHNGGQYQFLETGEQENLLKNAGFNILTHSTPIYSRQAFWVMGYK